MRVLITVALAIIVICTLCNTTVVCGEQPTHQGARQVVFNFSGWRTEGYEGGIGFRYFIKENVAIRPGIDVAFSNETTDNDVCFNEEEPDRSSLDTESDGFRIEFLPILEFYAYELNGTHIFWGGGIGYYYDQDDYKRVYLRDGDFYQAERRESTEHGVSVIGLVGLQWFFAQGVSLGAEYRVTFEHYWRDYEEVLWRTEDFWLEETTDRAGNRIDLGAGNLLVSIRL